MRLDRRGFLQEAGLAALSGPLAQAEAQHVHQHAAEVKAKGAYIPRALKRAEYETVRVLADMIIPPEGAQPGGVIAGAPEFIDLLCESAPQLREAWQGGLAWLDAYCRREHGGVFVKLSEADRIVVLDRIAYKRNASAELNPGIRFFALARQMVVDAWVTSPEGTKLLGYKGNVGMQKFEAPLEALNYALARSPFQAE